LVVISRGISKIQPSSSWNTSWMTLDVSLFLPLWSSLWGFLYTTCLLSCFQVIIISPSNYRWMKLKQSHQVHQSLLFFQLYCACGSEHHDYNESNWPL
jgi:hypothetical protein